MSARAGGTHAMAFSDKEQQQINAIVRRFEADTGVEAVASVIQKADAYPEIPWKAYALGSAIGALLAIAFKFLRPDWGGESTGAYDAMLVIGLGAVLAAATPFVPAAARLFLDPARARAEARQYALTLFLEHELFRTPERRAALVFVSRFERLALVIVDKGLAAYAPPPELERIAAAGGALLLNQGPVPCIEAVFEDLRALFNERGLVVMRGAADPIEGTMIHANDV